MPKPVLKSDKVRKAQKKVQRKLGASKKAAESIEVGMGIRRRRG